VGQAELRVAKSRCGTSGNNGAGPGWFAVVNSIQEVRWRRMNDRMRETGVEAYYHEQKKSPRY